MKVTAVEYTLIRLDTSLWFGDREPDWRREWLYPLFVFRTDSGIDGYSMGYAAGGDGRMIVAAMRDVYGAVLPGIDPIMSEDLWQRMRRRGRHLYSLTDVIAGIIDVGVWDLRGKLAGLPISALLGQCRGPDPTYATASRFLRDPEAVREEARARKAEGYHGYKLQLWDGPAADIPRVRAARESVGVDYPLMLDAGGQYDYVDALRVGRVLDELEYHWYEEPLPDRQATMLRRLAEQLHTPVMGTETLRLGELGEQAMTGAGDMLRGDVNIKAGITGMRKALGLAELLGYRMEIHSTTTPILDVANLHVAASTEASEFVETHHPMFRFGLKGDPLEPDTAGYVHVPSAPGLGVELDWDWIRDHSVESGSIA